MDTETLTPAQAMEQARETYRQSVDVGMPLSGQKLGDMFGKSRSWGRDRIAEVKREDDDSQAVEPTASANDTPEVTVPVPGATPDPVAVEVAAEPVPPVSDTPVMPDPEPVVVEPAATLAEVPEIGVAPVNAQVRTGDTLAELAVAEVADTRAPWQARAWAWAGFGLGTLASIAANVAHAQDTIGAKLAGAFVPVALIIAVEVMCRPIWQRPGWQWQLARYGGTGLVALVTAVMSYGHMHGLLLSYDESPLNAAIGPLAVDGLMVISGFAILAMSHKRAQR